MYGHIPYTTSRDCDNANHGDCWATACQCTCHDTDTPSEQDDD